MRLLPSDPTSEPSLHLSYPHSSLFKFPPASLPQVLPAPQSDYTIARPFNISPEFYNELLNVKYPITIAIIYAFTVIIINQSNSKRGNRPWAFSKSNAFFGFIIGHNIFLAIYSAWTFFGMFTAVRHSWPGWTGEGGLVGVADAMCKLNGPRGLGSAATFNSSTTSWGVTDQAIKLLGGNPDDTDVGRIWNEGLAFYGWLFYLSKFYEIVDTLIVLAKGKQSSILQTYHHAGAMICMWAGIRYMSPPIWMFVFVNSGIHTLMYTYYTVSALSINIPLTIKRTITALQIAQFVWGASYAVAHLFVAYSVPVNTPYLFTHNLSSALPAVTSSVSSAIASATVSIGVGDWLKKVALRAAGEEGLAENVRNSQGEMFGLDAIKAEEVERAQEEIRYRMEYQTVNCIDTSGQAFAILLNVMYLAPLTWLFIRFFIFSYSHKSRSTTTPPTQRQKIGNSVKDARKDTFKEVEREIHEAMTDEKGAHGIEMPAGIKAGMDQGFNSGVENMQKIGKEVKKKGIEALKLGKETANEEKENVESGAEKAGSKVPNEDAEAGDPISQSQGSDDMETLDEMAYEASIDDVKGEAEDKAEEEMQPNGA